MYTNPTPNIKLTVNDKVFVLGYHMPDDLKDVAEKNNNFTNNHHDKGMSGQHDMNKPNISKNEVVSPMGGKDSGLFKAGGNSVDEENVDTERNESNSGVYSVLADVNKLVNDLDLEIKDLDQSLAVHDDIIIDKIKQSLQDELRLGNKVEFMED